MHDHTSNRPGPILRTVTAIATAYVVVALILVLSGLIVRPERGPFALVQLFSGHAAIAALSVLPLALRANATRLRLALLALTVVVLVRFGGEWVSLPAATPGGPTLEVATFNLEIGSRDPADAVAFLLGQRVDVVALQELTPEYAAALEADAGIRAAYPERALVPIPGAFGFGILSRWPMSDVVFDQAKFGLVATVSTPDGPVRVLDGHPVPPSISRGPADLPSGFDPARRDALVATLRGWIDDELTRDIRLLVLGDFNTASTEPQLARLTAGLRDAHAEIGEGPGWTYRPNALERLGIGLVRIDLVLAGPGLRPTATAIACPERGDHCLVRATLVRTDPASD